MVNLRGPVVALLTPFDASGEIEWQAFKTYLTALFSWGVRTVIANGTTGEFPSLTLKERQKVVEFVRENFQGTIINNVSATCVSDVRNLIAGTQGYADAVLLLPPYYYSACRNNGLCRFFVSALSGTSLPVMLYNFPQHTGNHLGANLIAMLLDQCVAVQGIKDSSGDIDNAIIYKSHFPEVKIFFGNDAKVLDVLQKGLSGSVTGGANPLPELLIAIQADFQISGNKAQSMQRSLDVWNEFRETSGYFEIPLVKAAMGARIADFPLYVRPPFTPVPAKDIDRIRSVIIKCLSGFKTIVECS
jgi:dihydrodipicolinate synthase/N-acetylneuraminate lyase